MGNLVTRLNFLELLVQLFGNTVLQFLAAIDSSFFEQIR